MNEYTRSRHSSAAQSALIETGSASRRDKSGADLQRAVGNQSLTQMLDPSTREVMEQRFGADFSGVRIHTGARNGAQAYTAGNDIVFADGLYQPATSTGRNLLAHELAHTLQQRCGNTAMQARRRSSPREPLEREADAAAAAVEQGRNVRSASLTRGVSGVVQCKDGDDGGFGAGVLTLDWDIQFKLNHPTLEEMTAEPSAVLTESGIASLNLVLGMLADPSRDAELEGNASIEGAPDYNQQLSERRAQYIARLIGAARVRDVPQRKHMCTSMGSGLYACGTLHAHGSVDPADRRVQVSMFTPPDRVQTAVPFVPATAAAQGTTAPEKAAESSTQWSLGGGPGYIAHRYLLGASPSDPVNEAVFQIVGAYTLQRHAEGKAGPEWQTPVQLQISLTTGQVSLATGEQLSYVVPFGNNKWQWSAFAQLLGGVAYGSGTASLQFQPASGTSITFQPRKWLQLSGVAAGGLTLQTGGPQSVDWSATMAITFVH